MEKIKLYKVNAFTNQLFNGNPAAVCPLSEWLPDDIMQSIATENNLSETAFFIRKDHEIEIRWFTPKVEVELCGHATLACAHVIYNEYKYVDDKLIFSTFFGEKINVHKEKNLFFMDFPSHKTKKSPFNAKLLNNALDGTSPEDFLSGFYDIAIFKTQEEITSISPKFNLLKQLPNKGLIITAPGKNVDFVSRFFAPKLGIDEDPVTGSAHCLLIPYWYNRLNKKNMLALQLSPRGGELFCTYHNNRVGIGGYAVTFLEGEIRLP